MKSAIFLKHKIIFIIVVLLLSILVPFTFVQASQHPYLSKHGIVFSTGDKYLSANDVTVLSSAQSISFKRYYNSQGSKIGPLGYGWSIGFVPYLNLNYYGDNILLVEGNGRRVRFLSQGANVWANATGGKRTILLSDNVYELTDLSGRTRLFDESGRIIEERDRNNNSISYTYTGDLLSGISDSFGQQLTFSYVNNLVSVLSTPIGDFLYSYDTNNNLISVQKPDLTTRQYIYDDPNDPHNLTGIIDEENIRIQTIQYDAEDRVIASSLAGNSQGLIIEYPSETERKITDSRGVVTTYQLEINNGVARVASFVGPGCSSCGSDAGSVYVYNDRLQVTQVTDAKNNVTTYTYDASGNRTAKTEAVGTPEARTTSWTYEPGSDRISTITRASVANPGQSAVTTMTYDAGGNMQTRTESGYSGTTAISRTTSYTYDTYGRPETIDGPRTDVQDITAFTYYPNTDDQGYNRGNLEIVDNA